MINIMLRLIVLRKVPVAGHQRCGQGRHRRSGRRERRYGVTMRVEASREVAEFVRVRGGRLWVWAAHPRMCCAGTPAYMHAATEPPPGLTGFAPVPVEGLELWFRAPAGPGPDVLEIGLRGRRRPRVEAYWDGCLFALSA
jgi:hypothetical protein